MSASRQLLCVFPWMTMGGADKFNLDLLTQLAARGWRSTVVTTLPDGHVLRDAFVPVCDEMVDLARFPIESYPARMLAIARSRPFDVLLVSNSRVGYGLLPYVRAHVPTLTCVDYCHMEEPGWHDGGYPRVSVVSAGALDLQVVSSQHVRSWMVARGGDAGRIAVCTTNVDTQVWDPARVDGAAVRVALGIPLDAPVVLYAGRLERQKQPPLALRVMRSLVGQVPGLHVVIAGDGLFAGYVRRYVRWYGLERFVHVLGGVSSQRMVELLAMSSVFFLPSQQEGISLAIYEAMAMGVVPVGAAVGGQAELVTPGCGVLVARGPGEFDAYVAAILRLVREPHVLRTMGAACRQRVATQFRLDQVGVRMEALFALAEVLHRGCPRPVLAADALGASVRAAVEGARREQAELRAYRRAGSTPGQLLRVVFWRLVDRGAWWLVPLADGVRGRLGVMR